MNGLDPAPLLQPILQLQLEAEEKSKAILHALVASLEAEPAALTG